MVSTLDSSTQTAPLVSPNQSLGPLTSRTNNQGHLEIGGCDVVELVQQFGSPLYILDEWTLRRACQLYRDTLAQCYRGGSQVLYATKAWNCLAICALALQEGLGLDVASGGEMYTALQAGSKGEDLYLHGNAKSVDELKMALEVGCTLVADSLFELEQLAALATPDQPARLLLRINPGIDVHTHEYIRTGQTDSKFGIGQFQLPQVFEFLGQHPQLRCVGLHAHIGSQIFDLQGHRDLVGVLAQIWRQGLNKGLPLQELNVGGGLGIRYVESDDPPSIPAWVETVATAVQQGFGLAGIPLPKLLCEPGRSLIGPAAVTAYTLGGQKGIPASDDLPEGRTYITIDGGMSDNPRPITYQARYTALLANRPEAEPTQPVTVAGKHCESGDLLLKDILLPHPVAGEVLVVLATGAYNYSMASNYNRFPRAAAVLVHEGQAQLILQRETYADLIRQDLLPERLLR
ncbi:diaminopimelate decarboxylase [Synechococcus sp. Nb3U1]|uniref:diaminopimelate decarboxylase n=1 Tax=Synechococcus sp. Nb3U1 TaxID=1914529 RepID=UPI001F394492|nr:diaminopimelate decarboxylase [Synechococcus sp. Nb3U1]MCF2970457.1 diaminopimelate decarboxylase [Synechococcus sp. Nb3U1]